MDFPEVIRAIIHSYLHKCESLYLNGTSPVSFKHLSLEQVMTLPNPKHPEFIRWCYINDEPLPLINCSEDDLAELVSGACKQIPMSRRIMEFVEHYITNLPYSEFTELNLDRIYSCGFIASEESYAWFQKLGWIDDTFDIEQCILMCDDVTWFKKTHKHLRFPFNSAVARGATECLITVIEDNIIPIPENLIELCMIHNWEPTRLDRVYTALKLNKPVLRKIPDWENISFQTIKWILDHFDWSSFTKMDILFPHKPRFEVAIPLLHAFGMDMEDFYDDVRSICLIQHLQIIHEYYPKWFMRDISCIQFKTVEAYEYCFTKGSYSARPTIKWFTDLDFTPHMMPESIDECVQKYLRKVNRLCRRKREWLVRQLLKRHATPHYHFNIVLNTCMNNIELLRQIIPFVQWNLLDVHWILDQLDRMNITYFHRFFTELLYVAICSNNKVDLIAYACVELKIIPDIDDLHMDLYFHFLSDHNKVALCLLYPDKCMTYNDEEIRVWTHFLKKRKLK